VRLEAQQILQRHLNRVEHPDDYWEHERIILTGAYLEDVAFDDCELRRADFSDAIFAGTADFPHARFPTGATFRGARFLGTAIFIGAEFYSDAEYLARRKPGQLEFAEQHCADFRDVVFSDVSEWTVAKFFDDASFERARFPEASSQPSPSRRAPSSRTSPSRARCTSMFANAPCLTSIEQEPYPNSLTSYTSRSCSSPTPSSADTSD
jgi:hypothetical protein